MSSRTLLIVLPLALSCAEPDPAVDDGPTSSGAEDTTSADPSGASDGTAADPSGSTVADPSGSTAADTSGGTAPTTTGEPGGSPGCGLDVAPGAVDLSIDVDGMERTYILVIPDDYDPQRAYPLVFAWHGLGGDGALARLYFGVEQAAAGEAIILYPDGLPQDLVGGQTGWSLDDVMLFDALADELSNTACIDRERIFSTGHSFGGYMTNGLACLRGEVVRAIGQVAGGPSAVGECSGEVAAWLAHSPSDEVVLFSEGTAARDQYLMRNGCDETQAPVDPSPCVQYDGCLADHPVVWCDHEEGGANGHNWPNFAAPAIWAFFASF